MKIYDQNGKLILIGTVADWRENVKERKAQEKKSLTRKKRQRPSRIHGKKSKPLLKVRV